MLGRCCGLPVSPWWGPQRSAANVPVVLSVGQNQGKEGNIQRHPEFVASSSTLQPPNTRLMRVRTQQHACQLGIKLTTTLSRGARSLPASANPVAFHLACEIARHFPSQAQHHHHSQSRRRVCLPSRIPFTRYIHTAHSTSLWLFELAVVCFIVVMTLASALHGGDGPTLDPPEHSAPEARRESTTNTHLFTSEPPRESYGI